jgi:hypothetical protein
MDNIDKLLKHVTDNTDQIIDSIKYNDMTITEEQFEEALLEMIADGEVELIEEDDGVVKYKLTDK